MKTALRITGVVLALIGAAFAQGACKQDIALNKYGQPASGALVRVCQQTATGNSCNPLAPIYSNAALTIPIAGSTVTADQFGNYAFCAATGYYKVQVSAGGTTFTQTDVTLSAPGAASGIDAQLIKGIPVNLPTTRGQTPTFDGTGHFLMYNNRPVDVVRDCGLAGNGITDDSAALTACLALYGGHTLYFPNTVPGGCSYKLNSSITVNTTGTRLLGEGMGGGLGTKFCWPGSVPGLTLASSCTKCGVDHLLLDGGDPYGDINSEANYINPFDYGGTNRADGIRMLGGYQRVEHNQITNWGQHGISCDINSFPGNNCDSLYVANNWVDGVRGDCFRTQGVDAQDGTVINNTFQDCQWNGIFEHAFLGNVYIMNQVTNAHLDQFQVYHPTTRRATISTISVTGTTLDVQLTAPVVGGDFVAGDIVFIPNPGLANPAPYVIMSGYLKIASKISSTHYTITIADAYQQGFYGTLSGTGGIIRIASTAEQNWFNASGPSCGVNTTDFWAGRCPAYSRYAPVTNVGSIWINEYNELGSAPWCMASENTIKGQDASVQYDTRYTQCGNPPREGGFRYVGSTSFLPRMMATGRPGISGFTVGDAFQGPICDGTSRGDFYTNAGGTTVDWVNWRWDQITTGWFGPYYNNCGVAESEAYFMFMMGMNTSSHLGYLLFNRGFYAGTPASPIGPIMDGATGSLFVPAATAGKAACIKANKSIGFCSTTVDAAGNCTCN